MAGRLVFRAGALELGRSADWRGDPAALSRSIQELAAELDRLGYTGYRARPLREFGPLRRHGVAPLVFDAIRAPMDRGETEFLRANGKHDRVQRSCIVLKSARRSMNARVPTFNVGGWYDIFLQDTIANFRAMAAAGQPTKLLIGPWFDHWLRGRRHGSDAGTAVQALRDGRERLA